MIAGVVLIFWSWPPFALGADPSPSPDPYSQLINAGILGALAVCFILGLVTPGKNVDREAARADRAEERAEAMHADFRAMIPVLERAAAAVKASDEAATQRARDDAEMRVLLGQVRDALGRLDR